MNASESEICVLVHNEIINLNLEACVYGIEIHNNYLFELLAI
jgi:hypothetical protein